MAMTLPRWIVATALGAAAVWLFLFHTRAARTAQPAPSVEAQVSSSSAALAGAAMTRATDRLRLLQIRDSILRDPATRVPGSPVVLISAAYEPAIAHQLDSLIRERWTAAGAGGGARTVIAAVVDTATVVAGGLRPRTANATSITAFLPDSSAPCVSILRVPTTFDRRTPAGFRRDLVAPETIGALLGPCLYYATFGAPGPSVSRWLADGGWRLSHVTDWRSPPPPLVSVRFFEPRFAVNDAPALVYDARQWTTMGGLACLAGEAGRCMSSLQPRPRDAADTSWRRRVVSSLGADERVFRFPRGRSGLGPQEGWLLSEMVRTLGKERFAAFWRSNEPLADAFRVATNETLDDWVHEWAVRTYGPLPTGPGVGRSGVFAGAALFFFAVLVAGAIARTRRVS